MPRGTLTAYALEGAFGLSTRAEHTYVMSSNGHVWPCPLGARSRDGRPICSGIGNTSLADCLSRPHTKLKYAGIKYLLTGACHQMANRILYPSGQRISDVGAYDRLPFLFGMGSFFVYGAYGIDPNTGNQYSSRPGFQWPELQICLASHAHP